MRSILWSLVAGMIVAGCSAAPGSTIEPPAGTSSPTATASTSQSTATASVEPTSTSGPVGRFTPGEIAEVVTNNLVSRSAPGTGDDSEIYDGYFMAPTAVYIVDGPAVADGYEWYLVDPVRGQGIGEYPTTGWVAAADTDGEAWLGPDSFTCPTPEAVDLIWLERQRALACYGGSRLTMEGTLGDCITDNPIDTRPWATGCWVYHPGVDVDATPAPDCYDCFVPSLQIFSDGDIGIPDGGEGAAIRVVGHFDDPAASECTDDAQYAANPQLLVYYCRLTFVASSVEVIGS